MELKTMTKEHFDESIRAWVAVKQISDYLDECECNKNAPDIEWLRILLRGCTERVQ